MNHCTQCSWTGTNDELRLTTYPNGGDDTVCPKCGGRVEEIETKNTNTMGYMTNGLSFNTLRQANINRLPQFRNRKGKRAHSKKDGSDWSPAQWLQAVTGELGEYANLRKKYERGDMNEDEFKEQAKRELADIIIYLDILAYQLKIDLGKSVKEKFNEVSVRVDSTVFIGDDDDWHNVEISKEATP
jgi:NTP pyrophosphatase (non-canonical NTP hydrolase)